MKAAANCGANAASSQVVTVKNLNASGDVTLDIGQDNNIKLNFSCIQSGTLRNTIGNSLSDQINNDIQNIASAQIQSQLDSIASAKEQSGFASWGQGGTSTSTNTNINFTQNTTNNTHLANVIQKSIENNFSSDDIKTCISSMTGSQNVFIDDVTAGKNITFSINQSQALNSLSQCNQFQDSANNIVGTVMNVLGVGVTNNTQTSADTSVKTASSAETKNSGVFESAGTGISTAAQGVGTGISTAATGVGNAISSIFSSVALSYIAGIFLCVCCCMMVFGFLMFMMSGGSGSDGNNTSAGVESNTSSGASSSGNNINLEKIVGAVKVLDSLKKKHI